MAGGPAQQWVPWSPFSFDARACRERSKATLGTMLPLPLGSRAGLCPPLLGRGPSVVRSLMQGHKDGLRIYIAAQQTGCLTFSKSVP